MSAGRVPHRRGRLACKSPGGCCGIPIAQAPRDDHGRVVLTERQRAVLDFVREYIDRHGWAPTLDAISTEFGFSRRSAAKQHLDCLERKGWIVREPRASRAIRITEGC
jgi:hypothetical protein